MARTRPALAWIGLLVIWACGLTTAFAAPNCQDLQGRAVRCGSATAMPVGWSPTPAQRFDRRPTDGDAPGPVQIAAMLCVVGAVFALIALMPPFDGRDGKDWDEQEGDDRRR